MTNRNKLIAKLEDNIYGTLSIITMSGITISEIIYVDVKQKEDDKDIIYLVVDSASPECVSINYKAIKYIREYKDLIEITVG